MITPGAIPALSAIEYAIPVEITTGRNPNACPPNVVRRSGIANCFEKSVTLTFGLPFIRSSVDHGTAFDIAGKGIAGCISMIESTKVVAEYAAKQYEKKEA